jgi:glyceraldehyde 3-phosphate dehydrogenase
MVRIGINGFGRIGRIAARAGVQHHPEWHWRRINEPNGDAEMCAYLYNYDSVHGRANPASRAHDGGLALNGAVVPLSHTTSIDPADWADCDIVWECSGKYRTTAQLEPFFAAGVKQVIVAAPIKSGALNIVMGVNHTHYQPQHHRVVTAASCTTNCLAPIAHVIHSTLGIKHGMITTLHCMTNTQSVVDKPSKDVRRARSASTNLIPTSTGSASTIGLIIPALNGKLDGVAVRVPMLGASLTDCVFEVERPTTVAEVNNILKHASQTPQLRGILAYEEAPLVSSDFRSDPHSSIVDSSATMVTGGTQVKILAWYDNEMGYSQRMVELTNHITQALGLQ